MWNNEPVYFRRSHESNPKELRANIAGAFVGTAFGSFFCHLLLWSKFMQSQPRQPDIVRGLIYSMNNHGWVYYLSATQSTQLNILFYISFPLFVIGAIIYGRFPSKMPWEKYSVRGPDSPISLIIAFAISTAIFWFVSEPAAGFLVSKGMILS